MKYEETEASRCRYGYIAEKIWGDWDILWEDSEADYQGHASILANKNGKYAFYEWWYGSCSGCDTWESSEMTDEQIESEMKDTAMWLENEFELKKWLNMLEGNPISHHRDGGIVGNLDMITGGILGRINAIRAIFGMGDYSNKGDD